MQFKSKKAMVKALAKGRKFRYILNKEERGVISLDSKNAEFIYTLDGSVNPIYLLWNKINEDCWEEIIKLKWYENISETGVLCNVWDSEESEKFLALVTSYFSDASNVYKFRVNTTGYIHAKPLSKKQMKQLTKSTLGE